MVADLRIGCIDFGYISTLLRTRTLILEVRTEVQGRLITLLLSVKIRHYRTALRHRGV